MGTLHTDSYHRLQLADGRGLAYTVTGPAYGTPVVYCHGAIGTPVSATIDLERLTARLGVRYIQPSRPGVGGSDPDPNRTILSFAEDLRQLADAFGLGRFAVVGVSAGGPYALAAAHRLGLRVSRVALVSSLSPSYRPHNTPGVRKRIRYSLRAMQMLAPELRWLGDIALPVLTRHPGLVTKVIAANAAPAERARLSTPAERSAATRSFFDACNGGVGGLLADYDVYASEWRFDPRAVTTPADIWHGAADPLVPVQHARALAAQLPDCRTFIDESEGHHFFRSHLEEILATLIGADQAARTSAPTAGAQITQLPATTPAAAAQAA